MDSNFKNNIKGLKYAKFGGHLLKILLVLITINLIFTEDINNQLFKWFKIIYFISIIIILQFPFQKLEDNAFKIFFVILCILSIGFVFLMVVDVMFAYIAAAEIGERLGVPGFQGSLIFLTLLQIPTILFSRNPDLLD